MVKSMTAFANMDAHSNSEIIFWEIKSVNNKFLDINFRLPENFRELELNLKEIILKHIKRGKMDCTLKCQIINNTHNFILNKKMASKVLRITNDIAKNIHADAHINVVDILKWPGVLLTYTKPNAHLNKKIINLFIKTLYRFNKAREREGAGITRAVLIILKKIKTQIHALEKILPKIAKNQHQKLNERLQEVQTSLNQERFEQELILLLQKMDVQEEIDRLKMHIKEVERIFIDNDDAIGRRLDFLMQELQRESNTIASKSVNYQTTQIAVELKVLIEQIREQIQNVE